MPRDVRLLALSLALSLALASGLGCDDPGGEVEAALSRGADPALGTRSTPVDLDYEAVLLFAGDYTVIEQKMPIKAGGRLKVLYDPRRLPNCRATYNGMNTWSILWYYRTSPDGPVSSLPLTAAGAYMTALIPIPATATILESWFLNNDRGGCSQYDSRDGANYVWPVVLPQQTVDLVFDAAWQETPQGLLTQGGLFRIVYSPERLRACRATYAGGRAWNIQASWRFTPGGQTGTSGLLDGNYYAGEAGMTQPEVAIPADATAVELWFSNTDRAGCVAWDSNFDANYRFAIQPGGAATPRVGWVGGYDFVTFGNAAQHEGDVDPAYYWEEWAGMPRTSWVEVRVWVPGLTDRDYPLDEELRQAAAGIRAEAVTDALAGDVDGWGTVDLDFVGKRGNDFVYAFRFWKLVYPIYQNPPVASGLHQYTVRFSTDGGASWFAAGTEGGRPRRFVVAPRQDCSLFPDRAPAGCPVARAVGWAGEWGQHVTHACTYVAGLPDPVIFRKSGLGHDCMLITAEVWVEGLTDRGGDPAALLAQVETDLGFAGGPLAAPTTHDLTFLERVGNNYRYAWHLGEHVGRADRADYRFRFRFSGDGGLHWTTLGLPDGGWRSLKIRNDSGDIEPGEEVVGETVGRWLGATTGTVETLPYTIAADYPANFCEFAVTAFGRGSLSHNQVWARWLEAYIRVHPQQGELLEVGLLVNTRKNGVTATALSVGTEIEPDYWLTGFTYGRNASGLPHEGPLELEIVDFAFFIDVRRPTGEVVRLWQSNGGANWTLDACYAVPGYVQGIGIGAIEYADESVSLFDARRACF
ncbi:MAG: DUF6209 family protein [Myxococcota bacterium]|jgi:hypothetical protein|nr:DUF6209 family protein [Myxococcota bacterium]